MAILETLVFPDHRLINVAKPVLDFDVKLKKISEDLFDTMYYQQGFGIAATQVGINLRIVSIDLTKDRKNQLVIVNPEIIEAHGIASIDEGCLSVSDYRSSKVVRYKQVHFKAQDLQGNYFEIDADGLLAICIQHEIDHLNGKLFIDRLPEKDWQQFLSTQKFR